ncbi:glycosyltransferase family 39 protein [Candidatus Parcubacteria bacterium]|nr:glycosyltransferase family 39 protein [Candidatus Parcubacteria bacterium]
MLPLFGDEADVGYHAYSLLKTAKDYKGNLLPFYIDSLAESRAPLLMYTTIPFVLLFGLNPIAVRLPSVVFAILAIVYLYKLVKIQTKNSNLALLSSVFLGLSNWHFHYSRTAFEVSLLLTLILSGTYYFYKSLKKNQSFSPYLYLSIFIFSLSFYTYNTANIFTPLLVIFLILTNFKEIKKQATKKQAPAFLALFLLFPLAKNILSGSAANRFKLIGIFNNPKITEEIITKRTGFSATDSETERIFYNKLTKTLNIFTNNYLSSLSFNFLFRSGDPNPRHSPSDFGLLPITFLPLLLFGFFSINKNKKNGKANQLMFFWLLIAPIPTSLTIDGGTQATRLFLILPPLIYFVSKGFLAITNKSKIITILIITSLSINMIFYYRNYFVRYPKDSFQSWQYGYQQLMQSIPSNTNRLFISNSNYTSLIHYLFYSKYPPQSLHQSNFTDKTVDNFYQDLSGFKLNDQIFFVTNWNATSTIDKIAKIAQSSDTFVLFQLLDIPGDWDLSKNPPDGFKTIDTVYLPNNLIFAQIIQKL